MTVESDDEFFGDQSSESDFNCGADQVGGNEGIRGETPSDPFGNVANHDYRSREASIKTLSYLDGYDEMKEEKLQDGFSDGYRQSFSDAFRIGRRLGSLCAKSALDESLTLGLQVKNNKRGASNPESPKIVLGSHASLVKQFLTEEILIGSKDNAESSYDEALLRLEGQLKPSDTKN
mmetsp:Transcript_7909/g.14307  ORF Transcript_7909/g.14307 Transcript_7909/m.14307 type:complete len:177 (-) Transcript_7909:20-550(-)